jgi:hypothetical protein
VRKAELQSGPAAVRDALLSAVARWRFRPASRGGERIEATLLKEIRF